jgi:hypothetical protein
MGNIFIPALNAVLPYANAFLQTIRYIANELANLFGFELPEVDYSGLEGIASGAEDAADGLDGAADSAKELKGLLAGFDELNIIGSKSSGSDSDSVVSGGDLGINLPEYDFLSEQTKSKASQIFDEWKKKLEPFMGWLKENWNAVMTVVKGIGAALLAWKIASGVSKILAMLAASKVLQSTLGLVISVTGLRCNSMRQRKSAQTTPTLSTGFSLRSVLRLELAAAKLRLLRWWAQVQLSESVLLRRSLLP